MLNQTHFGPDLDGRNCGRQVSHAHRVVSCTGKSKDPVHFADPAMPYLPQQRDRVQPAEGLRKADGNDLASRLPLLVALSCG